MNLPEVKYVISDLQYRFLKGDIEREINGNESLINIECDYWRGFYGYYIGQMGQCKNIDEIRMRIETFIEDLLEYTYSILRSDLPTEDLNILYITLEKLENSRSQIEDILSVIGKTFNTQWEEKDIFVFLVPDSCVRAGTSSPLLLPAKSDFSNVVQILIHEFIHRSASGKRNNSVYKEIERKATIAGIGTQELNNRIMHPLFFYAAWKFVEESRLFEESIQEFYMFNEFSKTKYFLNTISMLKGLWPVNTNLDENFASKLIDMYITNPDRRRYKGVIL